jgi:hypothetical protein
MLEKRIQKLIEELSLLKEKAEYNSHKITENGHEYSDADRARSAGIADGYSYCILRLQGILC